MRAFVSGGSGYLGRNLIRALVARGDHVIALARSDAAAAVVAALGAEPVRGELENAELVRKGLHGSDVLFHTAAMVDEWGSRQQFRAINVDGTAHLLAAARAAGVPRFVLVGTEAVFADGGPMINLDEHTPLPKRPLPRYPTSKGEAEQLVRAANAPGFATVVVRPRLIWGGDDSSVLPKLLAAVKRGQFLWVNGGHYLTSTCHVDNVVEALLLAAERGQGGGAYFVTDGEPVEFRTFFTALFATQGVSVPDKQVSRGTALAFATVSEWLWEHLPLRGAPPVTRMALALGGQAVTVSDALARRELGYIGTITRDAGLQALRQAGPIRN